MDLRVRKPDGWTTVTLDDIEKATVVSGKTDGHLSLTLIGVRNGVPNAIVQHVLDVDPDDEGELASQVPRTAGGTSLPWTSCGRGERTGYFTLSNENQVLSVSSGLSDCGVVISKERY